MASNVRKRLEELLKKNFFYAPSFHIYGGVTGLYDYGPPGCALQANMIALWRSHFVLEEQMLEVDCTALTPYDVLKASGHVDRFTDFMVKDAKTGDVYRADHLLESALEKKVQDPACSADIKADCECILAQIDGYGQEDLQRLLEKFAVKSDLGNELTPVVKFNLMFPTDIGPTGAIKGFMRPETAQGQFVNFKKLLECNNDKMPFASAMIGKSFRNEISPRSGLLRVREFAMAEIEHYVHPDQKKHPKFNEVADFKLTFLPRSIQEQGSSVAKCVTVGEAVSSKMVDNETLGYFLARTAMFLLKIGIKPEKLRFRQHLSNEMSHYASDCWDAEIQSSYGWIECVGCADRSAYDLTQHSKATGERLIAREKLDSSQTVKVTKLELNKKDIGLAFKKDAKAVTDYLENMLESEIKCTFRNSGDVSIKIDGKTFNLTSTMVKAVEVTETLHVREYTPNVIEPSFGIGRIMYSLLEHSFWTREGDEQRAVLSFAAVVAPTKVLIAPLSTHDSFTPFIAEVKKVLRQSDLSIVIDESAASIGRRYARQDEVGTPFAVTVDFQTVSDHTVTVRERDSCQQTRVPMDAVRDVLVNLVAGHVTWEQTLAKYGVFTQQQLN